MHLLDEQFAPGLSDYWRTHLVGGGHLWRTGDGMRLAIGPATSERYVNAQIDDYQGLARRDFRWRPPLTLTVVARFSHPPDQLRGTAGFGFWNDPFAMTGARSFTLPRALWFFFNSAEGPMRLALQTPGYGWRAATIDGWRLPFLLLAPTAPLAMPLMRWPWLYRRVWPLAQWALGVSEALVALDSTEWHTYEVRWGKRSATFAVDGQRLFDCKTPPRGPLGLVFWMDNQSMVVQPWVLPRHQLLAVSQQQWLELRQVAITT